MKQYRQGDVFLKEIIDIPEIEDKTYYSVEGPIPDDGSLILAHGESTGHKHAIYDKNSILVKEKEGNRFFLIVIKETDLKHEEHDPIKLPVGKYEVIRQREYFPTEIRRVAD